MARKRYTAEPIKGTNSWRGYYFPQRRDRIKVRIFGPICGHRYVQRLAMRRMEEVVQREKEAMRCDVANQQPPSKSPPQ